MLAQALGTWAVLCWQLLAVTLLLKLQLVVRIHSGVVLFLVDCNVPMQIDGPGATTVPIYSSQG
jgi:hypothetical protein